MKTLKEFTLEYGYLSNSILVLTGYKPKTPKEILDCKGVEFFDTEQQAFDWLEANGYIERIKS